MKTTPLKGKNTKMTKLDQLLKFIGENPGCTRAQIRQGIDIGKMTLELYLNGYYGYREGGHRFIGRNFKSDPRRPAYFHTADYKPAKGRKVYKFFLNEKGEARVANL